MKKTLFYIAAIATIVASCAKQEIEETVSSEPTVKPSNQITIIASVDQTKTTMDGSGNFSWQGSEQIGVAEDGYTDVYAFDVANAAAGTFTGTKDGDLKYAVSPKSFISNVAADGVSYKITLPTTYTGYVSGTTNDIMIAGAPEKVGDDYKFTFKHAASLVKFTYENVPVGTSGFKFTADVNITGSFELTSTSNVTLTTPGTGGKTVTIMLASAVTELNQTLEFYVPVPVGTIGSFRAVLLTGSGTSVVEIAGTAKSKTADIVLNRCDVFVTPTITLANTMDILTFGFTGIDTSGSYEEWSDKAGTSTVVYAGQSYPNASNYIQIRDTSPSGIVTTSSSKKVKKISVNWNTKTSDGRTLTIYGSNTAYTSGSDLYNPSTRGTELGTIVYGTSTSLKVPSSDYYGYIGILASGALYMNELDIVWEEGKDPSNLSWSKSTGTATLLTAGNTTDLPSLTNPRGIELSDITFATSNASVATINASGVVSFVGEGTAKISATYSGDTYRPDKVEYTLSVTDSRDVASTPTFSPAAGEIAKNGTVTISSLTTGSTIYYTVNGDTPVVGGPTTVAGTEGEAEATVTIDVAKTVKAIAVKSTHKTSSVGSASYTITGEKVTLDDPEDVTVTNINPTTFAGTWTKDDAASDYEWVISTASTEGAIVKTGDGVNVIAEGTTGTSGVSLSGSTYTVNKTGLTLNQATAYYLYVKAIGTGSYNSSVHYSSAKKAYLIIDGSQLTSTATTAATDAEYSDITLTFSSGAKQQSSSGGNRFSTAAAILIGQSGAYINNSKEALPGSITKFEIFANSGGSGKVTYGIKFSATALAAYGTGATTYTVSKPSGNTIYDASAKLATNTKYFWFQVTNANNAQVQFRITYIPD